MRAVYGSFVAALIATLAGCGYADFDGSGSRVLPLLTDPGVRITATTERLWVSTHPLGDVGIGEMQTGESASAFCFVSEAKTNIGAKGSAVQIELAGERGYVAVEIIDPDNGDVIRFVNRSAAWLESRLPECRGDD